MSLKIVILIALLTLSLVSAANRTKCAGTTDCYTDNLVAVDNKLSTSDDIIFTPDMTLSVQLNRHEATLNWDIRDLDSLTDSILGYRVTVYGDQSNDIITKSALLPTCDTSFTTNEVEHFTSYRFCVVVYRKGNITKDGKSDGKTLEGQEGESYVKSRKSAAATEGRRGATTTERNPKGDNCIIGYVDSMEVVSGVMAAVVFILPCIAVLAIILHKDRQYRRKKERQARMIYKENGDTRVLIHSEIV